MCERKTTDILTAEQMRYVRGLEQTVRDIYAQAMTERPHREFDHMVGSLVDGLFALVAATNHVPLSAIMLQHLKVAVRHEYQIEGPFAMVLTLSPLPTPPPVDPSMIN